ncbi:hypothetical protein EW146_g1424 [Bondarzewia mesenterica]|uniref:Uncharacterized protein n=1 Tax=Bondarzewia mesenterica TaxID=1095465 RepID=A0A4S4M663_9AGAM|nr:hypothetical protein EW146_g1424 [Bondarzewia mesenterica]
MQGTETPSRAPITLFTLNSREDLAQYATGCDADIGGTSSVHLDLDENPEHNKTIGKPATAKFWGDMRLGVKPGLEGKLRGGYAGFRNKVRTSTSHAPTLKVTFSSFLFLTCCFLIRSTDRRCLVSSQTTSLSIASSPSVYAPRATRARATPTSSTSKPTGPSPPIFGNIVSTSRVPTAAGKTSLFVSFPLFPPSPSPFPSSLSPLTYPPFTHTQFSQVPFDAFVLTNTGEIASDQISMLRERIRTIGISLLGGNSGVEGPYELGIDEIRAVNEEDVSVPPST